MARLTVEIEYESVVVQEGDKTWSAAVPEIPGLVVTGARTKMAARRRLSRAAQQRIQETMGPGVTIGTCTTVKKRENDAQ